MDDLSNVLNRYITKTELELTTDWLICKLSLSQPTTFYTGRIETKSVRDQESILSTSVPYVEKALPDLSPLEILLAETRGPRNQLSPAVLDRALTRIEHRNRFYDVWAGSVFLDDYGYGKGAGK